MGSCPSLIALSMVRTEETIFFASKDTRGERTAVCRHQEGAGARSDRSKRTNPQWPCAARGAAPRARAHPKPRAHRGSCAPPPAQLPRPGRPTARSARATFACLRATCCVRCVHARRGVRSGEERRLCVLHAYVSLLIRVCPGLGEANEAQGPRPPTSPPACVRACGLACAKSPRLA